MISIYTCGFCDEASYPILQDGSCSLPVKNSSTNHECTIEDALFAIIVTPTVATASQLTYLMFHLLDTFRRQQILTLSVPTTKCVGKKLDVTNIGYLGLFLINFQEQLPFYKRDNVLVSTLRSLTALAKYQQIIGIADKLVTSTFQLLIQFIEHNVTQRGTQRATLRYAKLSWMILTAIDDTGVQITMCQRY